MIRLASQFIYSTFKSAFWQFQFIIFFSLETHLSAKNLLDQVGGFMGINLSQVLLSSIAFGVGYYIKARFEINQEKQIKELHTSIEVIEKKREEESRKSG